MKLTRREIATCQGFAICVGISRRRHRAGQAFVWRNGDRWEVWYVESIGANSTSMLIAKFALRRHAERFARSR